METIDVYSSTCIDLNKENAKDPQFEVDDHVRISKCKKNLQQITYQIGQKKFSRLQKLKILCHGLMLLAILMVKKLLERFTKKNCKKQVKKNVEFEK